MRKIVLLLAALLMVALLPATATAVVRTATTPVAPRLTAAPTAAELLAKTQGCDQVSQGRYKTDEEAGASVPVCDANGAVFWHADMDIDCDGQRTDRCNEDTDCCFLPDTAFHQSDGRPLDSAALPYVVVPSASGIWNYADFGLDGAGSCAVIYNGKVTYAVIGDTGPDEIIGEASYATASSLGIDPDPSTGGAESGVTYICFKDSAVSPIESHDQANAVGQGRAADFVAGN